MDKIVLKAASKYFCVLVSVSCWQVQWVTSIDRDIVPALLMGTVCPRVVDTSRHIVGSLLQLQQTKSKI